MFLLNTIKAERTIFGLLFGSLFPISGTLLHLMWENELITLDNILQTHISEPIFWIVDLAPIVLGIVFSFVGKREYELQKTNDLLLNTNQQLKELHNHLEDLVKERTEELATASEQVNKRANQLKTVIDLSHSLASISDLQSLLQQTTNMVSQHMGYYHVGIFLLNDTQEYAILKAANSVDGKKMLARGHRLRVDSEGIVGFVVSQGIPRIALDVGSDAAYFDNPDLPNTRSEVALPLKYGEVVFGALDIQSTEQNAFSNEDLSVLDGLAGQLSIVIQNANSLEQAQDAVARAESASRQLVGRVWSRFKTNAPITGYRYDGIKPEPLYTKNNGRPLEDEKDVFSIPIKLRGESIGRLRITPPLGERKWTEDEVAIIQATAESVALSAENARLIEESQKRASKEQIIGDISTKIGSSVNLRNVLQTAVEELGRTIPGSEVMIELKKARESSPEKSNDRVHS